MADDNQPKKPNGKNIQTEAADCFKWNSQDPAGSLETTRLAVEKEVDNIIQWYWREKRGKKVPSQWVQVLALVLTAGAGIAPVVVQVARAFGSTMAKGFDSGPLASLLVGLAAALLGLDKAFGFSTGWTRYVLTATSMTKLQHEFRMDWLALSAAADSPPTLAQQTGMLQRAKEFISAIQGMALQETKDWASEFQGSMSLMEKDIKAQLEALKAQTAKDAKDREAATRPGAIELTVTNADKTDGPHFDLLLEGQAGKVTDSINNAKVWTRIGVLPGQYRIEISAKSKGVVAITSGIVDVEAGKKATPSLTFPI